MHATAYFHVVRDALFDKSLDFQLILFHIVIVIVEFIDQARGSLNQLMVFYIKCQRNSKGSMEKCKKCS